MEKIYKLNYFKLYTYITLKSIQIQKVALFSKQLSMILQNICLNMLTWSIYKWLYKLYKDNQTKTKQFKIKMQNLHENSPKRENIEENEVAG